MSRTIPSSLPFAVSLATLVLATGCSRQGASTGPKAPDDLPAVVGIQRFVPIRFVEMEKTCTTRPCAPTLASMATLEKRVAEANAVYNGAGIQFFIKSLEAYPMPSFYDLIDDVAKNPDGNKTRSWAEIKGELGEVLGFPACVQANQGCPWGDTTKETERQWLIDVASLFSPPTEILVWVAWRNNGSQGQMPWEGRSITTNQTDLTYFNFSHEMGHFLGLPHTFSGIYDSDMNRALTFDPSTGKPIRFSQFYDLMFLPGPTPTFFTSEADAAQHELQLQTIDHPLPAQRGLSCKTTDNNQCVTTCDLTTEAGGGPSVQTATPPMRSLAPTFADDAASHPSRGFNVMSYFGSKSCEGFGISETQLMQIRKSLHYDMKNTRYPKVNVGRPQLGLGQTAPAH